MEAAGAIPSKLKQACGPSTPGSRVAAIPWCYLCCHQRPISLEEGLRAGHPIRWSALAALLVAYGVVVSTLKTGFEAASAASEPCDSRLMTLPAAAPSVCPDEPAADARAHAFL